MEGSDLHWKWETPGKQQVMTESHSQSQWVSKHAHLLPGLWKRVLPLLSRRNGGSAWLQMWQAAGCCRRARPGRQTHRHGCAQPSPPSLALTCVHCKQKLLPPGHFFTVSHSTRSSHSILDSFFFPLACLYNLEQQRCSHSCRQLNWVQQTDP